MTEVLVKIAQDGQHLYAWPGHLSPTLPAVSDERLRRVLAGIDTTLER